MDTVKQLVQKVTEEVALQCKKYIGTENQIPIMCEVIKKQALSILEKESIDCNESKYMKFKICKDDKDHTLIHIIPQNFFTFLLFHNCYVSYSKIKNRKIYKVPNDNVYGGGTFV